MAETLINPDRGAAEVSAERDEPEWIVRARSDPEAFARLYRAHKGPVADCIWRRVGDPDATEDLVAEVFLAALESLGKYRDRGIPFRHWLLGIATRKVSRWMRVRRRAGDALFERQRRAEEVRGEEEVDVEGVRLRVARLSRRHQEVVTLHYFEGLEPREVAVVLGVAEGTVKSRLARARTQLRQTWND